MAQLKDLLVTGDERIVGNSYNNSPKVAYGTCATAAATAAKEIVVADPAWNLQVGDIIGVKFTNSNSASSCTLNVNSTGAKSIWYNTSVYTGAGTNVCGTANRYNYYMYDGTYWVWLSYSNDANDNTDIRPSAYCNTAAGTAAKVASCTDYALLDNSYLHVLIKTANTSATALTLNVNSKGAKPIYINGTASSTTNYTLPAGTYIVFYDGTNYYFNTDGTIPRIISSTNSSIKNIIQISYDNYQTLVNNNQVDPNTEYHISEGSIASSSSLEETFIELIKQNGATFPIGAIIEYPATTNLPEGFLVCDGSAISRTAYAELFAIIGTTYGTGDGSTTFNLPNKKGRVSVGLNPNDTDFDTIGETGGSKYLQAHYHSMINYVSGYTGGSQSGYSTVLSGPAASGQQSAAVRTAGEGDSGNLQPYIVTNFIIKASRTVNLVGQVTDSLASDSTINAPSVHAAAQGAIIETGSNSNGTYIKYGNGVLICYKEIQKSVAITTAWVGMYEGSMTLGDWAYSFIEKPMVQATNVGGVGAFLESFNPLPTKTSCGTVWLARPNNATNNVTIAIMGIGKWK